MPPYTVLIYDPDVVAAFVTQRGLQTLLGSEWIVDVVYPLNEVWRRCAQSAIDALIVDPGPSSQLPLSQLHAIHKTCPHLPIIVLTAYDKPRIQRSLSTIPVETYLVKPIDIAQVADAVRGIVLQRAKFLSH